MATNDIKPSSSLPAVLEDITKRELDRPRTRRDIFDLAKKAIQIGGGSALDKSKIGDWIIGDDIVERDGVVEYIAAELYITNRDILEKIGKVLDRFPVGGGSKKYLDKLEAEFGEEFKDSLNSISKDLWKSSTYPTWYSEADRVVDNISSILQMDDNLDDILDWEIEPLSNPYKPIHKDTGMEIPLEHLSKESRDKLEEALPLLHSLSKLVADRYFLQKSLTDNISNEFPEIYDVQSPRLKEEIQPDDKTRQRYIQNKINSWINNKMRLDESETGLDVIRKDGDLVADNEKIRDAITQEINKAVRTYPKSITDTYSKKKEEPKKKGRRLIESAADLARRLSAPPTGTVPSDRQVKPPVQEPKPTQPKIPALEQPTEQGKGLSNLARMLPAVGRRLPFIAPAATLLRSKPAGVDADVVPPDPLGTGRVYRNYYDYNPRNI